MMHSSALVKIFMLVIVTFSYTFADVKKGQKRYIKVCKECHSDGAKGAAMKTQDEWEALFSDDGEAIIQRHDKTGAKSFFNSPKFLKYAPHLKDFLYEYGSDSGNIPAC